MKIKLRLVIIYCFYFLLSKDSIAELNPVICDSNINVISEKKISFFHMSIRFESKDGYIYLENKTNVSIKEIVLKFVYDNKNDNEKYFLRIMPTKDQCLTLSNGLKQNFIACKETETGIPLVVNKLGGALKVSNELRTIAICVMRN